MTKNKINKLNILSGVKNHDTILIVSGRQLGIDQRNKLKLDQIDKDQKKYNIIIPKNIISLNPSFFLGLFGESIRKLGNQENFLSKYNFSAGESIMMSVYDGIRDALNQVDVL